MTKVFAVMPAYNEAKNIGKTIKKLKQFVKDIVVVDDGSKDNTTDVAFQEGVTVLSHPVNLGKGAALRTGAEYAIEKGANVVILIDSDGQHAPEDIPHLIKALKKDVDMVFGYRAFDSTMPVIFRLGNSVLNLAMQVLTGIAIKDPQCGYKVFRAASYPLLEWGTNSYAVENEIILNVSKHKLNYVQEEVQTLYEDSVKGTTVLDGVKILLRTLFWRLFKW